MGIDLGKVNGVSRRAAAEHHAHERRKVAVACAHARVEDSPDNTAIQPAGRNDLPGIEPDLAGIHVEVEGAEDEVVVDADERLGDERSDLGIARGDREVDAERENLVLARNVEAAAEGSALAGDVELDALVGAVGVEMKVVGLEVLDQGGKGRAEIGGMDLVGHV